MEALVSEYGPDVVEVYVHIDYCCREPRRQKAIFAVNAVHSQDAVAGIEEAQECEAAYIWNSNHFVALIPTLLNS